MGGMRQISLRGPKVPKNGCSKKGDKIGKAGKNIKYSEPGRTATKWAGNGKKLAKNVGSGGTFAAAGVGALTLAKRDIILGGVKAKKSAVKNSRDKKKGDQETRIETQHASLPPRFRKVGQQDK